MHLGSLLAPADGHVIETGLVGVGEFGRTFLSQVRHVPDMSARVACDRDADRAVAAFAAVGMARDDVRICDNRTDALTAFEAGRCVVLRDASLMFDLPLDIVVEATGEPEAAAAIAEAALDSGRHVAMVTKEAESVVGPLLAHRARKAGLVHTPVDGDQPSLLIGLVAWARLLGLEIVCAGKASEYDFVFDPSTAHLHSQGRSVEVPNFASLWTANGSMGETAKARAVMLDMFQHRTVPDLCEMTIVANATGLEPDRPALHAPVARTVELADLFGPSGDGGLLERDGAVDIFNCLRRPDELSFAGGVFVVVRTPDPQTGRLFGEKGIPVSTDGRRMLIHNPVHLLGAEAPMSILSACRAGRSTAGDDVRPRIDLTGRASRAIAAGTRFDLGWRHTIEGVAAEMTTARPVGGQAALPYYLLPGAAARIDIPEGTAITPEMVDPPADSVRWRLRREQDALFAGAAV